MRGVTRSVLLGGEASPYRTGRNGARITACATQPGLGGFRRPKCPVLRRTGCLHRRAASVGRCVLQIVVQWFLMADTITFRPDEDTSRALEVLTRDGSPVSAVVRAALIEAARRKAGAAIRAEAERLAADESDRAESMQVLRDMETLRAW